MNDLPCGGQPAGLSSGGMPGPWVSALDNPGFMAAREWKAGEIIEAEVYDNSKGQQGRTLWVVQQEGKLDRNGKFLEARLVIVEDDHLSWWLKHGEGAKFKNVFYLHLCKGDTARCKEFNPRRPKEFHTDRLRVIDNDDVRLRKASWWQIGPAKAVFEKFGAHLMGEDKDGGRGLDEEFNFDPSEEEKEGELPAEAEMSGLEGKKAKRKETRLQKDLEELKAATGKPHPKKPPAGAKEEKKAKRKKREPEDVEVEPRRKKKARGDDADDSPAEAQPSRLWFGRKPDRERGEKERERRRRKRSSSSESSSSDRRKKKRKSKKKKKRARKNDRGPYGIGQKVNFQQEETSSSSSDSEESVFRGGPPRRDHSNFSLWSTQ